MLQKYKQFTADNGYSIRGSVQFEMAIYDDNIDFDKGWIFKNEKQDIIVGSY